METQVKVRDVMRQPVHSVTTDATLEKVARIMLDECVGGVPVLDEAGRLAGIITRSDFEIKEQALPFSAYRAPQLFGRWLTKAGLEAIYEAGRRIRARDVMSAPVVTATEDEPLSVVVERMLENDVNRIPVVRGGVPVGMISRLTLLELMLDRKGSARDA